MHSGLTTRGPSNPTHVNIQYSWMLFFLRDCIITPFLYIRCVKRLILPTLTSPWTSAAYCSCSFSPSEDKFRNVKLGQNRIERKRISPQDDIYNRRPRLPPPTHARSWFFFKIVLLVAENVGSLVFCSPKCLLSWLPLVSFSSVSWSQLSKRHCWEQRTSEWKFPPAASHIKCSHIGANGLHVLLLITCRCCRQGENEEFRGMKWGERGKQVGKEGW